VKTAAERLCSPGFDASTSVRDGGSQNGDPGLRNQMES
jgi:hypothetical protein